MTDLMTLQNLSQYYTETTSSTHTSPANGKVKFTPGLTNMAIKDVPAEYSAFATAITPDSLDLADFQYALAQLTIGKNFSTLPSAEQAKVAILREALGFPTEDPESVTLSFTTIATDNGILAVTQFVPANYDAALAPIYFPTGLHHSIAVYADFLQKLAIETGRKIIAFDSPGVGASVGNTKINHEILASSLKTVITRTTPNGQAVIVMGHSLSTIAVKDMLYTQDVGQEDQSTFRNPVEKYICIAPVPWGNDQRKGLIFAKDFMLDGVISMFTKSDRLVSKQTDAVNYYFPLHSGEDREWLKDKTTTQSFPIGPFAFLSALAVVGKQPLWDQMNNPKLDVVLADEDQIMRLKKPDEWKAQGAIILANADHSAIAGRDVNEEWVKQIAASIQE